MSNEVCEDTEANRHVPYSEVAGPSRVQNFDWCIKCGQWLPQGHTPTQ